MIQGKETILLNSKTVKTWVENVEFQTKAIQMFVFVSNTKDCYFIRQDREWEKYNGVGGGGTTTTTTKAWLIIPDGGEDE